MHCRPDIRIFATALLTLSELSWGCGIALLATLNTPIADWNFSDHRLALHPTHLLSAEYLQKIESELGPVASEIEWAHQSRCIIRLTCPLVRGYEPRRTFLTFQLKYDLLHPQDLVVDMLRTEDPFGPPTANSLKHSQQGARIPVGEFRTWIGKLREIARAGGFNHFRSDGVTSYPVYLLYEKFAGFGPADARTASTIDLMKRLWMFSKRRLPEEFRPKNLTEFNRLISGASYSFGENSLKEAWTTFRSTGIVSPKLAFIRDIHGEVSGSKDSIIGAIYETERRREIGFANLSHPELRLFGMDYLDDELTNLQLVAPVD